MANKTRTAIVKTTGEEVIVYRLHKGGWCNAKDCTTKYTDEQLTFTS